MARILVVDDEATLADTIGYNLRREGFEVNITQDGNEALRLARTTEPDLILLDLMLPDLDGLEICRRLRNEDNSIIPIIMLTAKDDEVDIVVGLEVGADDYITKPFNMRELITRIKALLRRTRSTTQATTTEREVLQVRELVVDISGRTVMIDGKPIYLNPKEFDLLAFLMRHPGRVFSQEYLLEKVWGYSYGGDTRTVSVHVSNIRKRLGDSASKPRWIDTVIRAGYRFIG